MLRKLNPKLSLKIWEDNNWRVLLQDVTINIRKNLETESKPDSNSSSGLTEPTPEFYPAKPQGHVSGAARNLLYLQIALVAFCNKISDSFNLFNETRILSTFLVIERTCYELILLSYYMYLLWFSFLSGKKEITQIKKIITCICFPWKARIFSFTSEKLAFGAMTRESNASMIFKTDNSPEATSVWPTLLFTDPTISGVILSLHKTSATALASADSNLCNIWKKSHRLLKFTIFTIHIVNYLPRWD